MRQEITYVCPICSLALPHESKEAKEYHAEQVKENKEALLRKGHTAEDYRAWERKRYDAYKIPNNLRP